MIVFEVLWFGWWTGNLISLIVLWWRAGITRTQTGVDWREFVAGNLDWFAVYWIGKTLVWPVVLWQWVDSGKPPSPWRAVTERDGQPVRAIVRTRAGHGA